jgi:molybdopterin-binding protein
VIEIGNGGPQIVAVLAKEASAKLGLQVGGDAYAVFKASSVSLGL